MGVEYRMVPIRQHLLRAATTSSVLALLAMSPACRLGAGARYPVLSVPPGQMATLKLDVLRALGGHLQYCDPDQFPIPQGTPVDAAKRRMPIIQQDAQTYRAILAFERLNPNRLKDQDLIRINDDYKQIQIIQLHPESSSYRFVVAVGTNNPPGTTTVEAAGTVDLSGHVQIAERHDVSGELMCPICLARNDMIATPGGDVPIQDMRIGMPIWTTDRRGRRIPGIVIRTGRIRALPGDEMVRLVLRDGRTILVSPGHPTPADGAVGDLRVGQAFEGTVVASVERIRYRGAETFDVLPSGPTGTYFANGVLLGSTLTLSQIGGGA